MKLRENEILWNAFEDELEKQAGVGSMVAKSLKYLKGLRTAGPTTLQSGMHLIPKAQLTAREAKYISTIPKEVPGAKGVLGTIKSMSPNNLIGTAAHNLEAFVKHPILVAKRDVAGLLYKKNNAGNIIKRTYNPLKREGWMSIGNAASKPLVGSGFIGAGGMYGLGKASGEDSGSALAGSAAFTIAPGLSGVGIAGKALIDANKAKKNTDNFYRPQNGQMSNNYEIH